MDINDEILNKITDNVLDNKKLIEEILKDNEYLLIAQNNNLDDNFRPVSCQIRGRYPDIARMIYIMMEKDRNFKTIIFTAFINYISNMNKTGAKELLKFIETKIK